MKTIEKNREAEDESLGHPDMECRNCGELGCHTLICFSCGTLHHECLVSCKSKARRDKAQKDREKAKAKAEGQLLI